MRAVEEYPGAMFKRCKGKYEARLYLMQQKAEQRLKVYIDGCTLRNGSPYACGGIGVFVAPNHPMNRAAPLVGKCTSQRAELMAAIRGLEEAIKNCQTKLVLGIELVTDSEYVQNVLCKWLWTWRQNGYRRTNGEPLKNVDLIRRLDATRKAYNEFYARDNPENSLNDAVTVNHVRGHKGNPGNEQADAFARKGALRYRKIHFGH